MKYSTALWGKKLLISPYSCAASVLLCDNTSVGRPKFRMTLATVIVFPDPVTPSSVWKRSPRSSPRVSSAIAFGWSPAGSNGACRSNAAFDILRITREALAPGNFGYALHAPRRFQNFFQVGKIADFDRKLTDDVPVGAVELETPDVRAGRRNSGGEIGIQAAPVGGLERQPHHKLLALQLLPVDLEPALRLLYEHEQVGTIGAMNADTAPSRYIPHNLVSGHGLTALGVAHHHPVDALDPYTFRRPTHAVDEPVQRARLGDLRVHFRVGI